MHVEAVRLEKPDNLNIRAGSNASRILPNERHASAPCASPGSGRRYVNLVREAYVRRVSLSSRLVCTAASDLTAARLQHPNLSRGARLVRHDVRKDGGPPCLHMPC